VGELENMLVRPKHRCRWRLGRLGWVEASIFTYKYYGTVGRPRDGDNAKSKFNTAQASFVKDANQGNAFLKLSSYETAMERRLYKALHELQNLPPGG